MTARAGGASLRRELRRSRKSIGEAERQAADSSIRATIRRLPVFRSARKVALFFAFDGEPDLVPLLRCSQPKEFYAPVITGSDMRFARIDDNTRFVANEFGIPEPAELTLIDARSLDLVLTPLVAFDDNGNRLGVGGGFYDRCFAFLLGRRYWRRPKLLGIGYALQKIEPIDPNSWDVPLWGAVTEHECLCFGSRR